MLFSIYIDDLIKELRSSGYGTHLSNLFIGSILYADDICLILHSCFGLQKMLDICYNYGVTWDILFNPVKSHLITFGGSTPKAALQLKNDTLGWSSKVKYLGLYLTSHAFSALTLLVRRQEEHPACKKLSGGVLAWLSVCSEVQLMPLPLTVSCFSKIQIGFAFLVPAHLGSPGKKAVKRVCVLKAKTRV